MLLSQIFLCSFWMVFFVCGTTHFPARRPMLSMSGLCVDAIWVCVFGWMFYPLRCQDLGFLCRILFSGEVDTVTGISYNTIDSYLINDIYIFFNLQSCFFFFSVWEVIKLFSIRIRVSKVWWFPDGILLSHLTCKCSHFMFSRHPTCPPAI